MAEDMMKSVRGLRPRHRRDMGTPPASEDEMMEGGAPEEELADETPEQKLEVALTKLGEVAQMSPAFARSLEPILADLGNLIKSGPGVESEAESPAPPPGRQLPPDLAEGPMIG